MNGVYTGASRAAAWAKANPNMTQMLESFTVTTFFLLHPVVQTFARLAQMLESTHMVMYTSPFAIVGLLGHSAKLCGALPLSVGLFTLVR